jgi:DNA-binding FadR family transcriptional regulator
MVSYVQVKDILRQRIIDGTWATGSRLPPERLLVEEIGASRNTIRKAVHALATERYVHLSKHARPVVLQNPDELRAQQAHPGAEARYIKSEGSESETEHDRASAVSDNHYMIDSSPLEVLEARLVIEPEAIALATLRARSDNIKEIKMALAESLAANSLEDFEHWDGQLHQYIFQATRNTTLIGYYQTLNQIRNQPSWIALKKKSVTEERRRLYDSQHVAIVDAIVNRQPDEAKRAMRAHLESVRNAMMV